MRKAFRVLRGFFLLMLLSLPSWAGADDLGAGRKALQSHSYKEAESHFVTAVSHASSNTAKAQALKLLGIAQYMQGKRKDATTSFRRAKGLDAGLGLRSDEILEVSLVDFYNSITPQAASPLVTPTPKAPHIKPLQSPPALVPSPPTERDVTARLQVLSSVSEARVSVDGIPRGRISDLVTLSVGVHEIVVQAEGYKPFKQSLITKAGELMTLTVNLEADIPSAPAMNPPTPPAIAKNETEEAPPATAAKKTRPVRTPKPITPITKAQKSSTPTTSSTDLESWAHWMPLGVPQFMADQPITGSLFALGQVGALGGGIALFMTASKDVISLDEYTAAREAESATITDTNKRNGFDDETQAEYDTRSAQIQTKSLQANILYGIAAGLWATSVVVSLASSSSASVAESSDEGRGFKTSSAQWKVGMDSPVSFGFSASF
jgi:hypothetical protein